MKEKTILAQNLSILKKRAPLAARAIESAEPSENFRKEEARNGSNIISEYVAPRWFALHSSMNPEREAGRAAEQHTREGYLICYGLGAGYYLKEAVNLLTPAKGIILLIDDNPERLRFLLSNFDYTPYFEYTGFRMLISPDTNSIVQALTDTYLPALYGNLGIFPLQSIVNRSRDRFREITAAVQTAIAGIKADFSVQAHFGKIWFHNITANLPATAACRYGTVSTLQQKIKGKKVLITGAGPGLSAFLEILKKRPPESFLLATDTSLPVLLANSIVPDAVINVDSQYYSLLHAIEPAAREIPWIVPISAAPALLRRLKQPHIFAGGHPLEQWLSLKLDLPGLETSGGNVLQTAVSLARLSEAAEISVYGADFCNPRGIPYATESYVYRWFMDRADRSAPLHSRLLRFTFDSRETLPTESIADKGYDPFYSSPKLSRYREFFETDQENSAVKLGWASPWGMKEFCTLNNQQNSGTGSSAKLQNSSTAVPVPVLQIIEQLCAEIDEAHPSSPALLYPLAAWFRGKGIIPDNAGADEALAFAREYARQKLRNLNDTE